MASIIEAFDSTIKENLAVIKIFLWALPVTACVSMQKTFMGNLLALVTAILLVGCVTTISHNIIKKEGKLIPGINVLQYGLTGVITIAVMLPFVLLGAGVNMLITSLVKVPSPVWSLTIQVLSLLLAASCVLASYVVYVRRLNPIEAFNLKKYFIGFGEVFLSFSYLVIKLAVCSVVLIGFFMYLFSMFLGFENVIWIYVLAAFFVFYSFIAANYMAQVSEELFTFIEKAEEEKREKEAIAKLGE